MKATKKKNNVECLFRGNGSEQKQTPSHFYIKIQRRLFSSALGSEMVGSFFGRFMPFFDELWDCFGPIRGHKTDRNIVKKKRLK